MAITIASPTDGVIQLGLLLPQYATQGACAIAGTPLPSGVTVGAPDAGVLPIIGAVAMGQVSSGAFDQSLP